MLRFEPCSHCKAHPLTRMIRCINIDWLEVHCVETEKRDAAYFQDCGWHVVQRDYGTRVYKEMFTLYTPNDEPFLEVRRAPATSTKAAQFFEPNSCHLRLHNRSCYIKGCARILYEFINQHGYEFRRIYRIDICLDFEKFDTGDDPQKFLNRYLNGRYSKINQTNITSHGKDLWDGRFWNSVSWGSPLSQVSTKMYNKTLELKEAKDKPYIRQAWASAGLVDDFIKLTKKAADGSVYTPDIWRVEFSIKSSVKNWFVMEHDELGNKKIRSVHNTLVDYFTDIQLLNVFASLCDHYFHFKKFEEGKRKDRCKDKELFRFGTIEQFYTVQRVATSKPQDSVLLALEKRLQHYADTHYNNDTKEAVYCILKAIRQELENNARTQPYNDSEANLLRRLIAYRLKNNKRSIDDDIKFIHELLTLSDKIF